MDNVRVLANASNTSAWRSFATISSAECLLLGMVVFLQIGIAKFTLSEGGRSLNAPAAERSAILTDLVLLAIGVTSVFGIGLALAEYGRAQTLDPSLIPYEGISSNVAQWTAARSTDDILLASLGMSLALIAIYTVFRMVKYKA